MSNTQSKMSAASVNRDILHLSSYDEDCSEDNVPFGSTLINSNLNKKHNIYKRKWKLPICITITGILYLPGNNWLSKIEQLFKETNYSVSCISVFEIVNANIVKLHFNNKIAANYVKHMLNKHVNTHYLYYIDIKM